MNTTWLRTYSQTRFGLKQIYGAKTTINSTLTKNYCTTKLQQVQNKFKEVFELILGHCTKLKAQIQLRDNAQPIVFKPRQIPFAYLQGTSAPSRQSNHRSSRNE